MNKTVRMQMLTGHEDTEGYADLVIQKSEQGAI